MKNIFFTATFIFWGLISAQQNKEAVLKKIDFQELSSIIEQKDDVLYVLNFWATWCKPCIEEIPGFMEVNKIHSDNPKFKMIMISLDFKGLLNTRVKRFVQKHNITVDVFLLDDERPIMELILELEPDRIGAIPSTAFYKNGKKLLFHQGFLNQYELEDLTDDFL